MAEAREELVTSRQASNREDLNRRRALLTRLETVVRDRRRRYLLINNHDLPIPPFNRQHAAETFAAYDEADRRAHDSATEALVFEELARRSWDSVRRAKDDQSRRLEWLFDHRLYQGLDALHDFAPPTPSPSPAPAPPGSPLNPICLD